MIQRTWIVLLALCCCLPVYADEANLRAALRDQEFSDANDALAAANEARAVVLAPDTYQSAASAYKKAERAYESGATLRRVRPNLEEAARKFEQAATIANTVKPFVASAFEARLDALAAKADESAEDLWVKAEQQFYEATSRAEQGRESGIQRYADKAEELYRDAELEAIEVTLFSTIEQQIKAAKDVDADDWAPQSYQWAKSLLEQARSELAANRYDTDKPRDLANSALHHARHAAFVAKLADDIDDNDTSLESVLLQWEARLRELAAKLDQPIYFDAGPDEAVAKLGGKIDEMITLQQSLSDALNESRNTARILDEELRQLQADFQGQEAAKARLDQRLAEQQRQAEKIRRIENLFEPFEAQVVRARNRLVLRMVGLSFSSGSAKLERRHEPVLAKLREAVMEFPQVPITIEGHTDSYGVDSANQALSVARAESVTKYLLDNVPVSAVQLSAVGYGESQPIANNETDEGRARNRRIDVVLYPGKVD